MANLIRVGTNMLSLVYNLFCNFPSQINIIPVQLLKKKKKVGFTCPVLTDFFSSKCSLRMLACNLKKAWISASVSKVFYCSAGPCARREALYLADLINRILFIIMGI